MAESTLKDIFTKASVIVGALTLLSSVVGGAWFVDARYVKNDELTAVQARLISEFRTESTKTRSVLIEDMESRLDDFDYDISKLEAAHQVVPEALRIKRNMLNRRIQTLKDENETPASSPPPDHQ